MLSKQALSKVVMLNRSQHTAKKRGAQRNKPRAQRKRLSALEVLARFKQVLSYLGMGGAIALVALAAITWMPAVKDWWSVPMTDIAFIGYTGGEFIGANTGGVSEEELLELALPLMGGSYWQLSVEQMKLAIESHPWVRRATVSKRWPAKVIVGIDEYVPVARWNEHQLMSMTGELFKVSNVDAYKDLPQFSIHWADHSEAVKVREMVERFNQYQTLLEPLSLEIKQMGLRTMDNVWLDIEGGLRIELGTQDHHKRLQRLIDFCLQQGVEQIQDWQVVDLRYVNGISVREKSAYVHSEQDINQMLGSAELQLTDRFEVNYG